MLHVGMQMSRKSSDGADTDVKKIRNVLSNSSLYLVMCCYESREHAMKRIAASVGWSVFLRCNSSASS
jgi:hypothetical protein